MESNKLTSCFLLLIFILTGCSSSRFQHKGDITNTNFTVEIPFEYKLDVILVNVVIEGKNYNFIWDTGAELNVIDQSIADQISTKSIRNASVRGSDNTSQKMGRLAIPSLTIGSLEVQSSVAVISDFTSISRFLGCLEIKGIIGNNIMRRANMQIDYKRKIITLTDNNEAFSFSDEAHIVKMNAGKIGNVKLKLAIDEDEQWLTFDTGFGGKIKSNNSALLSSHPHISSHGITGASLHSVNTGIVKYAYIVEGALAGIPFSNQVVNINESGSSLVGNKFLKHFTISTLWNEDKLVFDPIKPMNPDTIRPFELKITPNFNTSKIEIAKLYKDYTEFEEELIGWQVDKINDIDVDNFTAEELCAYWDKLTKKLKPVNEFNAEISKGKDSRKITVKRIVFDHNQVRK